MICAMEPRIRLKRHQLEVNIIKQNLKLQSISDREEMICAMEPRLRLKRFPTGVGLEPRTARSPSQR